VNSSAACPSAPILPPAPTGSHVGRARPSLGTLVRIEVAGLDDDEANAAIERGFAAIDAIHALMSFHESDSELSRLNREAAMRGIAVDARLLEVLRLAQSLSEASEGAFDVTVAPWLVEQGFLPAPAGAPAPDPEASWRDIRIEGGNVRFSRPLWIDLGGIAKGHAVDAALEAMALPRAAQACVDAGGDLRIAGPLARRVLLNAPGQRRDALPVVEVRDGAVASSSGSSSRRRVGDGWVGPHVDGRGRRVMPVERFATVVAPRCAVADGLTKLALAEGARGRGAAAFARFGATAHVFDRAGGWQSSGPPG